MGGTVGAELVVEGFLDVCLLLIHKFCSLSACLDLLFTGAAGHASSDETFLERVEGFVLLHFIHHVLLCVLCLIKKINS